MAKTLMTKFSELMNLLPISKIDFIKRVLIVFVVSFILMQSVSTLAQRHVLKHSVDQQLSKIKERIALDLPAIEHQLPILLEPNSEQQHYLTNLNQYLAHQQYDVQVMQIREQKHAPHSPKILNTNLYFRGTKIVIDYQKLETPWWHSFSQMSLLFSAIFAAFSVFHFYKHTPKVDLLAEQEISPQLISVDLHNKTLVNFKSGEHLSIANKPLCFYAALIEYCLTNPGKTLNPNKELPDEMKLLCKKYFARLIELGHTIRKRPDFTNNI